MRKFDTGVALSPATAYPVDYLLHDARHEYQGEKQTRRNHHGPRGTAQHIHPRAYEHL